MMKLFTRQMTEASATEILSWRYPSPYDLYNNEVSAEGIRDLLTHPYTAIVDENAKLVAFFCTGQSAIVPKGHDFNVYQQESLDIGLGVRPDLTGKGSGSIFLKFILSQIEADFLRLTVAKFNQRAIRLYEKFGFKQESEFDNGSTEFIVMTRIASENDSNSFTTRKARGKL